MGVALLLSLPAKEWLWSGLVVQSGQVCFDLVAFGLAWSAKEQIDVGHHIERESPRQSSQVQDVDVAGAGRHTIAVVVGTEWKCHIAYRVPSLHFVTSKRTAVIDQYCVEKGPELSTVAALKTSVCARDIRSEPLDFIHR